MKTSKILLPIIFGILITFGLVGGIAQASEQIAPPHASTAVTVYVDADATGAHDGTSWTDAYTTVQDALTIAISGTEIWVAEGLYYPDEGNGQTSNDRDSTFAMADGVALYGGFAATETLRTQRDWDVNVTVLSGDIDGNDITDPDGVVTDTANITGTNTYHVVSSNGVTETAVLDGFSITAGQADGGSGNTSGGGMYNENGSSPTLINVTFTGNWVGSHGGGMYNTDGSSPTLINVMFTNNLAEFGGGMASGSNCNPTLINVIFTGNRTHDSSIGGGMSNSQNNPTLINVTFTGNWANYGGGMSNSFSNPTLTNVVFSGNYASTDGGGMYNYRSSPTLMNVTFSGNLAVSSGGGMKNYVNSDASLTNVVFWGNLAGAAGYQIHNWQSNPIIRYSDIQGCGGSGSGWNSNLGTDGGGNIDANPLFIRDPFFGTNDYGNLHLQSGSPAINSGTNSGCPAADMDGFPRPYGPNCDMGAYEFGVLIQKNIDDPAPIPGQTVTFTITIANHAGDIAGGLISDSLPAGLNFFGPITLEPPEAGSVGLSPPTLASNLTISNVQHITLTFPVTVSYGLVSGTELINTAAFSSSEVITPMLSSVTVTVQNAAPIAQDDSGAGFTTDEDTIFTTGSVLDNDTDPNGDILVVAGLNTTGTLGLVTDNGDGAFGYDPNGQFEYLAVGEQVSDTFTYTVSDGHGGTDTATVTVKVTGVNDVPTANDDSGTSFTTDEDTLFTTGNVLVNDTDPDASDTLVVDNFNISGTLGVVTDNGNGTFGYDSNGQFDYLAVGEQASDTFIYTVSDGHGGTDTATVTITITGVNDAPTANDDSGASFTTNEDTLFTTGNVLVNDSDPDASDTLSVAGFDTTATLGLVTDNGDGTFEYDPNGQFESLAVGATATDAFTYTVSDGYGGTDAATVMITITGVQDGFYIYLPLVLKQP